ncbi:MAG TPA: hypothetical protein VHH09_05640 [Acidimicrobiales bacterium]|nr:hypothetical protein [Acidimicrobiales bacterium]
MSPAFQRFAALCALLAALAGVVFTVAFAVVVQEGERWAQWVSWAALLCGGLVTIPATIALYVILSEVEPQFALIGLVLGVAGALGAAVHGAFDLAVLANPPSTPVPDVPNAIDPRGFLTFAGAGLALLGFGWVLFRGGPSYRRLAWLALLGAALLLVVYVGRLTVLNPKTNVIRIAALASGIAVLPAFYLLLGWTLLRGAARMPPPVSGPER